MKFKVFSVFDVKARAFMTPFFLPEEGLAVRVFKDCCNNKEHAFGMHPEDYTLFRLAVFDDSNGSIRCFDGAESVHNGVEMVGHYEESKV